MDYNYLMKEAIEASKKAYAPYSKFPVGACVLAESGKIYCGCNFENSSYGLSICAERNAVGSAILNGDTRLVAIAVYSPNQDNCTPCGACRQVLHEFGKDMDVIVQIKGELKVYKLSQLLPEGFSL